MPFALGALHVVEDLRGFGVVSRLHGSLHLVHHDEQLLHLGLIVADEFRLIRRRDLPLLLRLQRQRGLGVGLDDTDVG